MANKIGIGITSTPNRVAHLHLCMDNIKKHSPDANVFVTVDYEGKGIAHAKNLCLKALKDCDYIFLFDDDCFPVKDGWVDFFINKSIETNEHHFLYLNRTHNRILTKNGLNIYKDCGGCMVFITQKVIKEVGGYYSGYGIYGFEHAGYSMRIFKGGLNTAPYICPVGANEYIYSLDMDLPRFDIKHHRSIPTAQCVRLINENAQHFKEDIKEVFRAI